jgi:hypothetical protein
MKKNKLATITMLAVLVLTCLPFFPAHAKRIIGLTVGTGLSFPMGDLADKSKYQANTGTKFNLGIDFYPIQALSFGPFLNGDIFHPSSLSFQDDYWQKTLPVSNIVVAEFGIAVRYFLRTDSKWQPYGKIWMGTSSLTINTENGSGASSDGAFAWGLGGGIMFVPIKQIGLATDLMYNNSKTGKGGLDSSDITSRINISVVLNILIGT